MTLTTMTDLLTETPTTVIEDHVLRITFRTVTIPEFRRQRADVGETVDDRAATVSEEERAKLSALCAALGLDWSVAATLTATGVLLKVKAPDYDDGGKELNLALSRTELVGADVATLAVAINGTLWG